MPILMVVDDPASWPLSIRGVEVVGARRYLTDPRFHRMADTRIFNLCQSYRYQSLGYYVSLLAEARAHKPQPDVTTIQDMKSSALVRAIAEDLEDLIQHTLRTVNPEKFDMSIYFGRTLALRDQVLGQRLFGRFRSPLLRVHFVRRGKWQLQSVRPIPASEIPDSHHEVVVEAAQAYFARRCRSSRASQPPRYYLAVLHDPKEEEPPSDETALRKFVRAAHRRDMAVDLITRDDSAHLGEFDALFIRATTYVNHYTYRFARRAAAEGLAVIDDPLSIARCTNKVYLAERMTLNRVPVPRTIIVHRGNADAVVGSLGLPLVLKKPDGAFSQGVVKVCTAEAYATTIEELLERSETVVAQAFMPTEFDWRVGVLDGEPLFVCKYYMARNHWQIMKHASNGQTRYGRTETLAIEDAPRRVVMTAVRAARLIGDGLYGVDLKLVGEKAYIIEVNDNPNINSGHEDRVLKDALYDRVIESFIRRIERIREGNTGRVRRATAQTV